MLPEGYRTERPALTDVTEILELVHASDIAAIGYPDFVPGDVEAALTGPSVDPTTGVTGWPRRCCRPRSPATRGWGGSPSGSAWDTSSPTKAFTLYERLGFTVAYRANIYRRPVAAGEGLTRWGHDHTGDARLRPRP